jgi:hypothetical protein
MGNAINTPTTNSMKAKKNVVTGDLLSRLTFETRIRFLFTADSIFFTCSLFV